MAFLDDINDAVEIGRELSSVQLASPTSCSKLRVNKLARTALDTQIGNIAAASIRNPTISTKLLSGNSAITSPNDKIESEASDLSEDIDSLERLNPIQFSSFLWIKLWYILSYGNLSIKC